ncbi:MAG: GNAT family N-acetyltransferase, partial [Gemmobacter sp.]
MLDTLTIRTASPADLADVEALLARVYPRSLSAHYPPSVMVTAVPLIARARPGLLASGRYYVAVTEAGALVGAGGWSLRRGVAPADDMAEVRHVVTCDRM